ncbi:hypothetical protein F4805DRAFT_468613 [Annulohypoxylon moriforme]|nr:hypothetical protein F4805DRAFT_468613 [Annulohypoxylon moriforme]
MNASAAKHVGAKLLGEVEEGSLEELLDSLRVNLIGGPSNIRPEIPIPGLANIAARYHKATQSAPPPVLSVSGRYLPLLYHLISTLIAEPHNYTIVVVDAENRFDVTRLVSHSHPTTHPSGSSSYPAELSDLRHVHVYRPARGQEQLRAAVAAASQWMIYGSHESRAREWWGTIVIGGGSGTGGGMSVKGDVNAGWKGWLRVEREEVSGFPAGVSVEEALRDRDKRQEVVDDAGWVAMSRVGGYVWKDA